MAMRIGGLMSGMDTESIIKELVAVKQTKVDDTRKAQTKLKWKQEAWKELNSKLMRFYDKYLGTMRLSSDYVKKVTKVSNPNVASVITGEGSMNSVLNMHVTDLASSDYLTGAKLNGSTPYTSETKLTDAAADGGMGIAVGSKVEINTSKGATTIEITDGMKVKDLVAELQKAGVNASFDENQQRFYVGAKETGKDKGFQLVAANGDGIAALDTLGLSYYGDATSPDPSDTELYYKSIIDNEQNIKDSLYAEKKASLLNQKKAYESNMNNLMKTITDNYADEFAGVDITNAQDIKDHINSMDPDSKTYKALQSWGTKYDTAKQGLDDAMSHLEVTGTDSDGNDIYDLNTSTKNTIDAEVTDKVNFAQNMLNRIQGNGAPLNGSATKMNGTDATITLNGETYTSSSNSFSINGLTITVNAKTDPASPVTITTMDDTDGIYDMIKGFIKEYNSLVNEMDKLYNADSARGYEPLTDEEKDGMSDTKIDEWEDKIKDAILRKDTTLGSVSGAMKEIMMSGVTVDGKKMYLSDFGIETLSYFLSAENEKNAYHIAGDSDDEYTSGTEDKLKSMIANDPDTVVSFFTQLSRSMYTKMTDLMKQTDYSSSYTAYDDKKMKLEYDDYTAKIKDLEKKLNDYEDKWYAKFAAMETALAKMQSNASAVTSLLGGS